MEKLINYITDVKFRSEPAAISFMVHRYGACNVLLIFKSLPHELSATLHWWSRRSPKYASAAAQSVSPKIHFILSFLLYIYIYIYTDACFFDRKMHILSLPKCLGIRSSITVFLIPKYFLHPVLKKWNLYKRLGATHSFKHFN